MTEPGTDTFRENTNASRSFRAVVVENRAVNADCFLLTFSPLSSTPEPRPGQFYMVGVGTFHEPLLKRPFCFFGRDGGGIGILYRVRGKGTALLKEMKAGEELEVLGPLGNSFPRPPKKQTPVVVAGGIAIASVFPLIQSLKGRAVVVYGARNRDELVMLEEVRAMAGELHVCTDDGSLGDRGTALDALQRIRPGGDATLYVCGPRGMTEAVARFAAAQGLKGCVSLEEYMACGIGACMGCVVMTRRGYKRVCKEGPIFRLEELAP